MRLPAVNGEASTLFDRDTPRTEVRGIPRSPARRLTGFAIVIPSFQRILSFMPRLPSDAIAIPLVLLTGSRIPFNDLRLIDL